jgi:hypothetical protein
MSSLHHALALGTTQNSNKDRRSQSKTPVELPLAAADDVRPAGLAKPDEPPAITRSRWNHPRRSRLTRDLWKTQCGGYRSRDSVRCGPPPGMSDGPPPAMNRSRWKRHLHHHPTRSRSVHIVALHSQNSLPSPILIIPPSSSRNTKPPQANSSRHHLRGAVDKMRKEKKKKKHPTNSKFYSAPNRHK